MSDAYCKISEIRERVDVDLSSYFSQMSSEEFEGYEVFPDNAKELMSIFLSVSAEQKPEDIIGAFDTVENPDDLGDMYSQAVQEIRKDYNLAFQIVGIAKKLGIPEKKLAL